MGVFICALEVRIIVHLVFLSFHSRTCFPCLYLVQFFTSLLSGEFIVIHNIHILFNTLCNCSTHKPPWFRSENNIFFVGWRIIKACGSLNRIAMRNVIKNNGPSGSSLKICDSEKTAVIPKDFCFERKYFWEYPGFVIIVFPDFVFRAIEENILFDWVSMKI